MSDDCTGDPRHEHEADRGHYEQHGQHTPDKGLEAEQPHQQTGRRIGAQGGDAPDEHRGARLWQLRAGELHLRGADGGDAGSRHQRDHARDNQHGTKAVLIGHEPGQVGRQERLVTVLLEPLPARLQHDVVLVAEIVRLVVALLAHVLRRVEVLVSQVLDEL